MNVQVPPLYVDIFKEAGYYIHALPYLDLSNHAVSEHEYVDPRLMTSPVMRFRDSKGKVGVAIRLRNTKSFMMNGKKVNAYEKSFVLALVQGYPKWVYSCPYTYKSKHIYHTVLKSILSHQDDQWGIVVLVDIF